MSEEPDQIAVRYVLGLARGEERAQIEGRIDNDPDLKAKIDRWEESFVPLDLAAVSSSPPADLFDSVMRAIGAAGAGLPGTMTIRAAAAQWTEMSPGVSCRILHDDLVARRRSMLVRVEPGAIYAGHGHPECDEACLVIEGDLAFGDLKLFSGDFHLAHVASDHPPSTTVGGCLLHITTSL